MSVKEYHKLVRDLIPQIIAKSGKKAVTRTLSMPEYRAELNQKLLEETREYLASEDVEELADIMEVIRALLDLRGISFASLEEIRLQKQKKNGAFGQRIYLEQVISDGYD